VSALLQEVSIRNFALIDEARLALSPGLNVLTGETGAGKSILIDAVELALGGRASAEVIRTGADRAVIDVVFDLSRTPEVGRLVAEMGLADADDPTLVICREIPIDGRTTCRVNGRAVSLTALREVTQHLIDIHGQHEHQSLLRSDRHVDLLDAFGGNEAAALRRETAAAHRAWQKTLADIRSLAGDERDRARRLDLLRFQVEEIGRAKLRGGEEEELQAERRLLANAEKRREAVALAYACLYSSDGAGPAAARDQIGRALDALEELVSLDPSLAGVLEVVRQTSYQLDDASHELRHYRDGVLADPMRLAEVESRLDLITALKRKYGHSVAEVLAFGEDSRAELGRLENSAELLAELEAESMKRRADLEAVAGRLSAVRRRVSQDLEKAVEASLADLGMKKVCFRVQMEPEDPPGARGAERAEFLFSPNPGEPPKPLGRIASGGEMSRVMLALKAILAAADEIPTMIFDEIDSGVGGGSAQAVGEKLAAIALSRQVICVTHLARIASLADAHHFILKEAAGGRTQTNVRTLDPERRVEEVARMLAGEPPTPITLAHAREMLEQGLKAKESLRQAVTEAAPASELLFPS
jgi:DNA repair protein RecN (Recombination protein N)